MKTMHFMATMIGIAFLSAASSSLNLSAQTGTPASPPEVINNNIVRIHFDHSRGMIDSITFKPGSGNQLLDQYWNNTNQRGLERVWHPAGGETGTICTSWNVMPDSAVFSYSNPMYGTKQFHLKWCANLGFEMKANFQFIAVSDTFYTGALWKPGGDNNTHYDSLRVNTPVGPEFIMINYPGLYQSLYYGYSTLVGVWDSRFNEVLGYYDLEPQYIRTGTGASLDGPFHRFPSPGNYTVYFGIKDNHSFWNSEWGQCNVNTIAEYEPEKSVQMKAFPSFCTDKTTLTFTLIKEGRVVFRLFDLTGKFLKVVSDDYMQSGSNILALDLTGNLPGIYCCQLQGTGFILSCRVVKIR